MEIHTTSASMEIRALPERVWSVLSDITVMPRFSTELLAVQWAEGFTHPRLGAKFIGTNHHPAIGRWQTTSEIIAFDPPTVFAWAVGRPEMAAATWRFDLIPTAIGTTTTYTAAIGPGSSGVTMMIERSPDRAAQIVRNRLAQLRNAMAATLAGIREIAEDGC